MSCLGSNYNPKPPREWYRFENVCAYNNTNINNLGLVNLNGKTYPLSNLKKGNSKSKHRKVNSGSALGLECNS
jgi:hypothetical protein